MDLEELDAQLDKVADSIAADTSVRPEKDGGVTVLEGDNKAERYLTAEEYRAALTNCTAAEIPNPSIGEPSAPAPGPSTPTTTAPVVPAPAPSQPSTPSKTRPQTIASTGTTATWVAVGAVAVLVAGIGALIASRRAKN